MSSRQQSLLESPQNLAMWVILQERGNCDLKGVRSASALMRLFWKDRYGQLVKEGLDSGIIQEVLGLFVGAMEDRGRIWAPARLLDPHPHVSALVAFRWNYPDRRESDNLLPPKLSGLPKSPTVCCARSMMATGRFEIGWAAKRTSLYSDVSSCALFSLSCSRKSRIGSKGLFKTSFAGTESVFTSSIWY